MTTPGRDPILWKWSRGFAAAALLGAMVLGMPAATAQSASAGASAAARPRALDQDPFAAMTQTAPRAVPDLTFVDGKGAPRRLAQFRGKLVLLNVWATWCPPCRHEMPTLERLQATLGGPDFEVVALSIDRGGRAAVESFFDEIDAKALKVYVDSTTAVRNELALTAFPTTLLIDRQGREIGRYTGGANWDSPEVVATLRKYLAAPKT
ncbi:MAG: TlpA family protein disulfide reductase [Candidatus Levyibacteriota bacterium]